MDYMITMITLTYVSFSYLQGRRRVLKSGTAIERHRCSPSEGEHERGFDPRLVRGVWGISPGKIFKFKMSVEAILRSFLLVKLGLLYGHYMTLYSNLFRTQHQSMNSYFDPSIGFFFKGLNCSNYLL